MGLKQSSGSNVLNFPGPSPETPASVRARQQAAREESLVTAEGLLLMHAFFKIASSEDRQKVIALAERLRRADDRTVKD
jgi:hypothetical protein